MSLNKDILLRRFLYMGVFPRGTIGALSLPVANVSGVTRTRRIDD